MAAKVRIHPEALFEYGEAAEYYLREAAPAVAEGFVQAVEAAATALAADPDRWRVVEPPEIRRYLLGRFPFVIYYRWEPEIQRVVIYAIMHCSREPGYWRRRVGED